MAAGGVRPGAGRKPVLAEHTVKQLLETSAEILTRWMNNPDIPDERKIPVCSELIKRRVPNATEIDGKLDTGAINYILIRNNANKQDTQTQSEAGRVHI